MKSKSCSNRYNIRSLLSFLLSRTSLWPEVYKEGDRTLNQSVAIARYVASKTDLLPSDPWDQAVLDAAVLTIYDFWSTSKLLSIIHTYSL